MSPDAAWEAGAPFVGALGPVVIIGVAVQLLLQWVREVGR